MDKTLLRLPDLQELMSEIKLISAEIKNRGRISELDKLKLIQLSTLLKDQIQTLNKNVVNAFENNPFGNLSPKLSSDLAEFLDSLNQINQIINLTITNGQIQSSVLKKFVK